MNHKICKNDKLPFVELRYAKDVQGCSKSHTHEMITITAIAQGQVNLVLKSQKVKLSHHQIAFLNPHTAHCVEILEQDCQGDYVLHLDVNWCTAIQKELFGNTDYIPVQDTIIDDISTYQDFMLLCHKLLSTISLLEKEEHIIRFITKIFSVHCDATIPPARPTQTTRLSQEIKGYLDANFQHDITLGELSQKFGLTSVYIIRVFKDTFDLPIHAYLLNKKVHKARELLCTKQSIVEIALTSGFYDQSHLNKSFKRVFSITPKEYRDNISKC